MILITGATGTVGSEVVKRLSGQGAEIRAVTSDLHKVNAIRLQHVEFVQGDFDDPDSLRRACTGVERAFLLSIPGHLESLPATMRQFLPDLSTSNVPYDANEFSGK